MMNIATLLNRCSGSITVRMTRALVTALLVAALGACASVNTVGSKLNTAGNAVSDALTDDVSPDDPIEPVNRVIYKFNDAFDRALLQPVAKGYANVVPLPVRNCVRNVFSNIADIPAAINNTLQAKLGSAATDTGRFLVNSTVGILGCFDVASDMGMEKHKEDFGQTLGYWGVPSGPYLMLPFLGPSTVRDVVGKFTLDTRTNAIYYIDTVSSRNLTYALDTVDSRASALDARSFLEDASLDPYVFLREAYLGRRRNMISDGQIGSIVQDDVTAQAEALEADKETTANVIATPDQQGTTGAGGSVFLKVGGNER